MNQKVLIEVVLTDIRDKDMEKILDKDQLKQYKANKAEMEARKAERKAKKS